MLKILFNPLFFFVLVFAVSGPVKAVKLRVTGGEEKPVPIAVVPFAFEGLGGESPVAVDQVIEYDMLISGRYEPIPPTDFISKPTTAEQVRFKDWRLLNAEAVVIGRVRENGAGQFTVAVNLFDVITEREFFADIYGPMPASDLRAAGHRIADKVYEALTGERGQFSTKITYVTEQVVNDRKIQQLNVAWPDGNAEDPPWTQYVLRTTDESIQSPRWSPDGTQIAYARRDFNTGRNRIIIQSIFGEVRETVVWDQPGTTSAPAWAPDGTRLALSSSKDGNPEIYIITPGQQPRRLTRNQAIDTQPAWSPNNRSIAFTSNRGRKQQIYEMFITGGAAKRLTYNVESAEDPFYSADGKKLVMIANLGDGDQVVVYDIQTGDITQLSDPGIHESPTFSPSGKLVLYHTKSGGRTRLRVVRADGRMQGHDLKYARGTLFDPAWARNYIEQ